VLTNTVDQIGAVTREVASGERDGEETRVVIVSRSLATDIEDAWDALTSARRLPRWFSPVRGELRLGGRYQVEGNASGEILECQPPSRLAATWEFGGGVSWIVVTLVEQEGGTTQLRLEHTARTDADFLEFWDQFGPGAVGVGWDLSLLGLAEHLEHGFTKTPEMDTAWPVSDDGRAFIAGSSEGWLAASVAFGTEPSAAAAAAERTTAFYTGG
jgi:uncharacterized protein YndB with AHSA1/START domain